jgi:hypothetical protein
MIPSPCDKQKLHWTKNQYVPDEIYNSSFFDVFLWNLYYFFSIPICGTSRTGGALIDWGLLAQTNATVIYIIMHYRLIGRFGGVYVAALLLLGVLVRTIQLRFLDVNILTLALSLDVMSIGYHLFNPPVALRARAGLLQIPVNPIVAGVHPNILLNRRIMRFIDTTPLHFSAAAAGGKR